MNFIIHNLKFVLLLLVHVLCIHNNLTIVDIFHRSHNNYFKFLKFYIMYTVFLILGYWVSELYSQKLPLFDMNSILSFHLNVLTLHSLLMELSYNNYLISKIDSKFISHNTLTNLSLTRQYEQRFFRFEVVPELASITAQANYFAQYIAATSIFENSFITSNRRIEQVVQLLADTYLYSYIKALSYAYGRNERNVIYMMGPNNSLTFHGHKVLHDIIAEGYIQQFIPSNNIVSMQLDLPSSAIATIQSWPIWEESFNTTTSTLFNAQFEAVLGWLERKSKGMVQVSQIGHSLCDESRNITISPLGNLCFSVDMLSIKFIENIALLNDKVSYYFGKANMISVTEYPSIDADDDIYDTVLVSNYDNVGVTFEVQSITGFNPLSKIMSQKDIAENRDGGNSPSPFRGRQAYPINNGSSPNSGPRSNSPHRNNNSNNNSPGQQTQNTAFTRNANNVQKFILNKKNQFVKVGKEAVSIVQNIDAILTDDGINSMAKIVSAVTGRNLSPKDFRNRVGSRIGSILYDYGIHPEDTNTITNDFDEFRTLTQSDKNGVLHTELVGIQKLLTQK